jgi:hypothetical protein
MEDKRDWLKYHTLTEHELEEEIRRSQEVRKNMLTLTGKMKDGKIVKPRKSPGSITVTAPHFGTSSKEKRTEKKAWEKELKTAGTSGKTMKNSRFQGTMEQLLANTKDLPSEEEEEEPEPETEAYDYSEEFASNEQKAFSIIQTKYEQNLNVVEKLYHEKQSLEEYTRTLERELEALGRSVPRKPRREIDEFDEQFQQPAGGDQDLPEDDYNESRVVRPKPSTDPFSKIKKNSFTAEELAAMMNSGSAHESRRSSRSHSAPRNRSTDRPLSASAPRSRGGFQQSQDDNYNNFDLNRSRSSDHLSVNSSASRGAGVSRNLQADIDRFVQKRKLLTEKEKFLKSQQDNYQAVMDEKRTRASLSGKEFTAMKEREEFARSKLKERERRHAEKERLIEEEKRFQEEQKQKLLLKRAQKELSTKSGKSWDELQMEAERDRKDRIEKRSQELAMMSSLPKSMEENYQRQSLKLSSKSHDQERENSDHLRKRPSLEPTEVTDRLKRQQEKWDNRLSREREKSQERRQSVSAGGSGVLSGGINGRSSSDLFASMQKREKETREKREARIRAQQEREEREKEKKLYEDRVKREKLLSLPLPANALKLTNAEILKQKKVLRDKLDAEREEQREMKRRHEKEMSAKETSAVLSIVLKERQEKLKMKNPGYVELMSSQAADRLIQEKAKHARDEYRLKLRENKARMQESVKKNRPSLLERHDKDIAMRNARNNALLTVAKTVTDSMGDYDEKNGGSDEDDLFGDFKNKRKSSNRSGKSIQEEIFEPIEQLKIGIK